jgi:hypothetical protein
MATPGRKDQAEFEENQDEKLTTADIAQGPRAVTEASRPRPVVSGRGFDQGSRVRESVPLFPSHELDGLRTRWKEIQTGFVDEPRKAVQAADGLVASAMKRLAEMFSEERSGLEQQWDRGDNVSTEDLRVALQRYRTFFDRLLSV